MFDRINRRHSIRYKNTNVDGNADKLNKENSSMNKREFIKLGVMGVLGSLLPTDNTKEDKLVINTNHNVGMSINNPNGILRIMGTHYPDGGIGV